MKGRGTAHALVDQRVRLLPTVRHEEYRGQCGTVERYVKVHESFDVRLDDGRLYRAYAQNVEIVAD